MRAPRTGPLTYATTRPAAARRTRTGHVHVRCAHVTWNLEIRALLARSCEERHTERRGGYTTAARGGGSTTAHPPGPRRRPSTSAAAAATAPTAASSSRRRRRSALDDRTAWELLGRERRARTAEGATATATRLLGSPDQLPSDVVCRVSVSHRVERAGLDTKIEAADPAARQDERRAVTGCEDDGMTAHVV